MCKLGHSNSAFAMQMINAGNEAANWALNRKRLITWGFYDLAAAYQSVYINY
ncbi:MAG: hypothetical protein ACOX8E_03040 [Ruminococcus sp.]|jgi:hypothetical protein